MQNTEPSKPVPIAQHEDMASLFHPVTLPAGAGLCHGRDDVSFQTLEQRAKALDALKAPYVQAVFPA